jgi:hypothetical protein
MAPEEPQWFRRHSSQVSGAGHPWVAASGAKGLSALEIRLADKGAAPRKYTIALHFLEPDDVQPGERLFDVSLQGKPVIESLDVAREAGGKNRSLVRIFTGVEVREHLSIDLAWTPESKVKACVLSGVEIKAEGW